MRKEPIILLGGGGHCRSCIDVIEMEGRFEIVGILDTIEKVGTSILDIEIIGIDDDILELSKKFRNFFITIGHIKSVEKRVTISKRLLEAGAILPVIKSPIAYVSNHSTIGAGTIVMHHAEINAGSKIGENCIINSKALIEHDSIIGSFVHVSTGAIINGGVQVGDYSFIGSGSVTIQNTTIPPGSFIKAHSLNRNNI